MTNIAKRIGTRVSAVALSSALLWTPQATAESLREVLAATYATNPQLDAQRAALRALDETVRQAKSNYLPSISGDYTRVEADVQALNTDAEGNVIAPGTGEILTGDDIPGFEPAPNETIGIQFNQTLFRGFRTHNEIQQAKANVYAGRAQLQVVEQQTLLDAVTAYMDVYRDEATVRLNQSNVEVLQRELQASMDRFRVGEVTRTDVAQSEATLEGAKATLASSVAILAASRARYERVIGSPPGTLEAEKAPRALPDSLDEAVEIAVAQSPNIEQARQTEEAARKAIHVAQGTLAPTVNLQGRIQENSGTQFFGGIETTAQVTSRSLVLNINVPFYTGGLLHSQVRQAKQTRSQRMLEIAQAERVARENVLAAWNQYAAAEAQILSQQAAVRANEIALEGVRQEARVGSRTTLNVLNAQQALLNSQVQLVQAQRDATVAGYTLLSSVGSLTAIDLGLEVPLYDPTEHYKNVRNKLIGF